MSVELLSWKIHSEILNFEQEAAEKLEGLVELLSKKKIERFNKGEESLDEKVDSQSCIVVIMVDPKNM